MTDVNDQTPQSEIDSIIALFSDNKLQEALDKVKTLTKSFPKDSLLQNITGACYAGLGQLGSAVKSYEKAIAINPNYAKAHYNLGNAMHDLALKGLGHLDDPIKSYKRSLEIDPDYAEAHNNLGNVLKDLGRLDEAFESFEKALAINPEYLEAYYSLGIVLFDLGQLNEAAQSYQKAIEINPSFTQAHNNLGNTFAEQGQLNDAIQSYQKAIEINPNYSEAYNNLGNVFIEHGQLDKAVESFEVAVSINPRFDEAYYNLGVALERLHRFDDAIKAFVNAENIKTDTEYSLGNILNAKMQSCSWDNFYNLLEKLEKKINDNKKIVDPFNLKAWIDDPALQRKATEIKVNSDFPKNNIWFDFYTNERFEGGQTKSISKRENSIPTFVKAGSFIPMAKPMQTTQEYDGNTIELHYYFDSTITESKGQLYNDDGLTFFQGSFFTHDGDRETLNLGFGKRMFNADESIMFGLNAFYDHELDYDHQRTSLGAEIKSLILELNTNHYFAISNEVTGKNNIKEEVADGYDLEIGAHVPYVPTAKFYTKYFEYDIPGGSDFEGLEYSSKIGIPISWSN